MLKTLLYCGMTFGGLAVGLFHPLIAAIVYIQVYFVDPKYVTDMKDVRYQFMAAAVLILAIMIRMPKPTQKAGKEGILIGALVAYGLLCLASTQWTMGEYNFSWNCAVEMCKTLIFALLLLFVIRTEKDLTIFLLACIAGIWHTCFMQTFGVYHLDWVSRSRLQFILTDRTGSVILLFLPLIVLLAMYGRKWERILCWFTMPFILEALVRSNHRAYFVALVFQVGLLLMFLPKRIVKRVLPFLLIAAFLFIFVLTPASYWEWVSTITSPTEESSAASRFDINRVSVKMITKYPMGVGYRSYNRVFERLKSPGMKTKRSHNTFFSVLCETGVQGFAAWGVAVFGALYLLRRVRKRSNPSKPTRLELYAVAFEFGIYGSLMGDMFHSGYETDPLYWIVVITVIIVRLIAKTNREEYYAAAAWHAAQSGAVAQAGSSPGGSPPSPEPVHS